MMFINDNAHDISENDAYKLYRLERGHKMKKKTKGHPIKTVMPNSIGEEMGIEPGDYLVAINNEEIDDVFDYQYLIKDEYIEVLIRKSSGEEWILEIDKEYDEDLGIDFENGLMSDYRSCHNKCIFCFIDQMPEGMRETLYFKDDDSRLSFLQGNYITLTNMSEKDINRIIRFNLAPINISVQTTNPELRCKMLNNRFAGGALKNLDKLYEGCIEMNGQIVLCKHVNDGPELERSIKDLSKYLPFMRSVSVVPAGITKYRKGLYPLELFTKEEAGSVIDLIESYQQGFYDRFGLHFIHASDEFYIIAEREFPEEERYDGYIQLENGVGMMRLFINEFQEALNNRMESQEYEHLKQSLHRNITIATGKLAYKVLHSFSEKIMEAFPNIKINVVCIRNDFFGETITVAGLITGQDLIKQLKEQKDKGTDLGTSLLIPSSMLRTGENVFLDDITAEEVEKELKIELVPIESGGQEFINSILHKDYRMNRNNENFVYVKAYEK
jgi:putative radical SAM enzyme (TIGR03279 family)